MDTTKFVVFVSSMAIALPVYYFAARSVIVLTRPRYWRNPFCKIFINLTIYALLVIHLYMPGLGWLGGYCIKISGTRFLSTEMWIANSGVFASHCLNALQALNRLTSLTLSREKNRRFWRLGTFLTFGGVALICPLIHIEILMGTTTYQPVIIAANFTVYYITSSYDFVSAVYIIFLIYAFDVAINVVVFYKFIAMRWGSGWERSSFEKSLHVYSFAMFFAGLLSCAVQLALRYGPTTNDVQLLLHTFSNVSLNLLLLAPTVFILAFTSEIRRQVITCCYLRRDSFEINPII